VGDRPSREGIRSRSDFDRTTWLYWRRFVREHPAFPEMPERCACGAELLGRALELEAGRFVCCADCGTGTCRCPETVEVTRGS
jgi:hypothetical protein